MSKYKVGDKVVMKIISADQDEIKTYSVSGVDNNWRWCLPQNLLERYTEPLSTYTEPLSNKVADQRKEINHLLRKIKEKEAAIERLEDELRSRAQKLTWQKGVEAGQKEAWELAKKIVIQNGYSSCDLYEIFGTSDLQHVLENYTYPEAAAKVEAWEKEKEEIKVGDEVEKNDLRDVRFIVTFTNGRLMSGVTQSGLVFANEKPKEWHKTGRHIDIDSFLKQIGDEE